MLAQNGLVWVVGKRLSLPTKPLRVDDLNVAPAPLSLIAEDAEEL